MFKHIYVFMSDFHTLKIILIYIYIYIYTYDHFNEVTIEW